MWKNFKEFLDREQKVVGVVGNFLVPFTIGYLLNSVMTIHNWRFWVIIVLVLAYRGTRGKNG
jgi:hypothetical protein